MPGTPVWPGVNGARGQKIESVDRGRRAGPRGTAPTLAEGLTPFAAENSIKILRRQGTEEQVFPFEYAEVKKGRGLEQNIFLKGGDVVVVP